MSLQSKLVDLQNRRQLIEQGGGAELVKKQHDAGRMTARERLSAFFDEGSFIEIGAFVKQRPTEFSCLAADAAAEGVITGYGGVDGRLVYAFAQDITAMDGALSEMHARKIERLYDLALKMGAPVVGIFDSNGGRVAEGIDVLAGYSSIIKKSVDASGVIPQLAVVAGVCAGSAAFIAANFDFTVITEEASMFLTPPVVLKAAIGENIENVGNAAGAVENGNAHFSCKDDKEALGLTRYLLSYLPNNNMETAIAQTGEDFERITPELNEIDNSNEENVRYIISSVADTDSFLEIQKDFASTMIIGFARIGGETVGVVANCGTLCAGCTTKSARFISLCDSFNIPIITFSGCEGFEMSAKQEKKQIRSIAHYISAYAGATVPKVNVICGPIYGGVYSAMLTGSDIIYAWPQVSIGYMKPDAAVTILNNEDLAKAADPISYRAELEAKYKDILTSPYETAKRGYIDDIIEPAATRPYVASALEMLSSKREVKPQKKHGNMPV
jgi:acetyl-CoA carboxylase carboxyltransferase component